MFEGQDLSLFSELASVESLSGYTSRVERFRIIANRDQLTPFSLVE